MGPSTIGQIQLIATIDTSQYKRGAKDIENTNKNLEGSAQTTEKRSNKLFTSIAKVGLAGIAAAAVAAGALISKNIGGAVRRIDTLDNSARVFQNLGFAADDVETAMNNLDKSLRGLPTRLDDAVLGVQELAASTGDVVKGQKLFESLNNAVLGLGGTSHDVESAVLAMSRSFDRGRLQGQEWNMLITSGLGPALQNLAKQMGITSGELQEGLSDGTISVEDFGDALLKANKEGAGSMASFEKQAKDATSGIGTTWENMNAAITRGIGEVIKTIGSENIAGAVEDIGSAFEGALKNVAGFFDFVIRNKNVFAPIAVGISVMIGLLTAWFVATKVLAAAQAVLNAVLAANPIGLIIIAVAGLVAGILWLWNNVEGFRNFWITAWGTIRGAVVGVFNWVKNNWPKILTFLAGPFGLAVGLIIRNFDRIRSAVGSVWNWIRGVFGTIGQVAASIIRIPVNAIIGFAQNTINNFIRAVNAAIGAINRIPGVDIGRLGEINIPRLARGGIITSPTLAMVGEGNEAEAVIPLSKLDQMLERGSGDTNNNSSITINLQGTFATSPAEQRRVAEQIAQRIREVQTSRGLNGSIA